MQKTKISFPVWGSPGHPGLSGKNNGPEYQARRDKGSQCVKSFFGNLAIITIREMAVDP